MGSCCNANRNINLATNQEELKEHVDDEIRLIKQVRAEEEKDAAKRKKEDPTSKTAPVGIKIDLLPSCEEMSLNLGKFKIPLNEFDEAKKLFNKFYNSVEDDDYENAIKTKVIINEKYFTEIKLETKADMSIITSKNPIIEENPEGHGESTFFN